MTIPVTDSSLNSSDDEQNLIDVEATVGMDEEATGKAIVEPDHQNDLNDLNDASSAQPSIEEASGNFANVNDENDEIEVTEVTTEVTINAEQNDEVSSLDNTATFKEDEAQELINQIDNEELTDSNLSVEDDSLSGDLAENASSELTTVDSEGAAIDSQDEIDDVEMSLFDHLEELRTRIFYALAAIFVSIIGCFTFANQIVGWLEIPAKGVKFLQLSPGEYFFVSLKVAGYSGILLASPAILYQIVRFVLPGLTKREKQFVAPIVFGSSVLFIFGIGFAYVALIPAALNFFISYGGDVVEQLWSIDRYFEFVLLLLFSTGLAFQIPVIQVLLSLTGIVSSRRMLSGWRYVVLGAVVLGAVLTPSTDPMTQTLLASAVGGLYFGGIGIVKLLGN